MKKYYKGGILFLILLLFMKGFLACDITDKNGKKDESKLEIPKEEGNLVKKQIDDMTLDEKVGQLFIVGFEGTEVNNTITKMITEKRVGGFILFSNNIKSVNQTADLTKYMKAINRVNKLPLLISVDEEGGRVERMPKEVKPMPKANQYGIKNSDSLAYKGGSAIGKELIALGFNTDFAPVLDVFSNPDNKVIGDRAFSTDAEKVKNLAVPMMQGIASEKVLPFVKHFPGHGDTVADSHVKVPVINHSLDRLNSLELVPFKEAILKGAEGVMIGHLLVKAIDDKNIASQSEKVIKGVLREQLGFKGLVITDDMTMGGLTSTISVEEGAFKALKAGCDLVLICHDSSAQLRAIERIKSAISKGELTSEEIDEKLYRIISVKNKYEMSKETYMSPNINEINANIQNLYNELK